MAVIDGMNINGTGYDLRDKVAVRFNEAQSLTEAQKAQARENIGATAGAVLYDSQQALTDGQKAVARNNIDAVSNDDFDEALNYYTETEVTISAAPEGWNLDGTGKCVKSSTYKLVKYEVTPGDTLHLKLSKDSDGVYQWQNAASVPSNLPNNNLVGTPVTTAIDGNVTVPTGATYLIVSQYKANTTNAVKLVTADGTIKDKIDEVAGIANGAVSFDVEQTLTDAQKETARNNIGAGTTNGAIGTITLGTSWSSGNPHTQTVTVSDYTVTENTKVDLLVTPTSLSALRGMGVSGIQAYNDNGVVTVYAYGKAPTESVLLYCLCAEVVGTDTPEPAVLPSEYQRVEYIQSDGSGQLINTQIYPGPNHTVTLDLQFLSAGNMERIHGLTGYQPQGSTRCGIGTATDGKWYFGCGNQNIHDTVDADINRHTLSIDYPNRNYRVDSRTVSMPSGMSMYESNVTFALFGRVSTDYGYTQPEAYCDCKLYSAVFTENGAKVADFVPCYVKATGTIGLYDTVRNQFFANVGTGAFTKGGNV